VAATDLKLGLGLGFRVAATDLKLVAAAQCRPAAATALHRHLNPDPNPSPSPNPNITLTAAHSMAAPTAPAAAVAEIRLQLSSNPMLYCQTFRTCDRENEKRKRQHTKKAVSDQIFIGLRLFCMLSFSFFVFSVAGRKSLTIFSSETDLPGLQQLGGAQTAECLGLEFELVLASAAAARRCSD